MSEQDEEYFWRSQVKADVLAILQECKEDGVCDDESIAASVADAIPSPDMVEQILQENTSLRAREQSHIETIQALRARVAEVEGVNAELKQAIDLVMQEIVASGNWDAKDFGWPKAVAAVKAVQRHF